MSASAAQEERDPILGGLTPAQREAVEHGDGPLLVIAGPGSGKTRVITRRIARLIRDGVPPWRILAVTFTNKAAAEMRRRVALLLTGADTADDRALRGLTISTFHALCARLLRRFADEAGAPGLTPRFSIYDTADQRALMKRVIADVGLSSSQFQPASVLSTISDAKNRLLDTDAFAAEAQDFYARSVARLYAAYERALRGADAVDFDDLLLLAVRALERSETMRSEVRRRWSHLLVDEYQDTNHAQFALTTLLAGGIDGSASARIIAPTQPPNLCVVGDPDQSIYGWRGANIANILDFERVYPSCKVVTLGENFRSTASILAAADAVIRRNARRKHKQLVATRDAGSLPTLLTCEDERAEARAVVEWAQQLRQGASPSPPAPLPEGEGGNTDPLPEAYERLAWSDIAIFYRVNALSRVLEEELRAAGVPYVIARGTAFYEREEIRDALAYLRVVANPADETALRRIVNKPARGLGGVSLARLDDLAKARDIPLYEAMRRACAPGNPAGLSDRARNATAAFVDLIEGFREGDQFLGEDVGEALRELVERVIRESSLEKHYATAKKRGESAPDEEKIENLAELISAAGDFDMERFERERSAAGGRAGESGEESADDDLPPELADDILEPADSPSERSLLATLRRYLESIALVADADVIDADAGALTLMTLHAAKGLEFNAAAIVGLEEGLLPHARARESDADLEEERRLFFVGMTRAMDHLLMTTCVFRTHRGLHQRTIPSAFLEELPEAGINRRGESLSHSVSSDVDPLERLSSAQRSAASTARSGERRVVSDAEEELERLGVKPGARVRHQRFGVGVVEQVLLAGFGGPRLKVRFRDLGLKTLVLPHAPIEVVG